jgi:hypothetical protein
MTTRYEEVFEEFSAEDKQWIKRRAEELKAEELNLREMRRLRKLTQARLSRKLKIGQEGVSRIEKRTDLYLSTLRSYVEGVGGKLLLMVEFPDQQPVILAGLGEVSAKIASKRKAKRNAGSGVKSKAGTRRAA